MDDLMVRMADHLRTWPTTESYLWGIVTKTLLAEFDALKAQPSQPRVAVLVVWQYRDRPDLSWRECSEESHNIMRDEKGCDVEVRALCVASPSTADVAGEEI